MKIRKKNSLIRQSWDILESLPKMQVYVLLSVEFPDATMHPEAAMPIWPDILQTWENMLVTRTLIP